MTKIVFLVHVLSTLSMLGGIWFAQIVHYPLYRLVGHASFPAYEAAHTRLTTWVVAPIMLAEASSSLWLLFQRPEGIAPLQVWLGVGLVALIWLSTVLLQVPMHLRLERGFDPVVQHSLVTTNWMRTVAWSLRGLLVLWMMAAVAW